MRLEKKNIHMNKIVKSETVIFFVSREERIMDADNEIESIINQKEIVTTDGVVTRENQITVNGTINYNILYYPKNSEMVCGEEKEINFEENIKLMGINSEDNANVTMEVLSSSIKPVDGKNYIYKIQLKAYIIVEKIEDLDIATAIDTDSQEENYENNFAKENSGKNNVEDIMTKKRNIDSLAIMADKTDTFRVSEQIAVPHGKPPIGTIVWSDIRIKNQNIKTMEGSIIINGQLSIFIIYIPEMENMPEQWLEQTIDFNGQLVFGRNYPQFRNKMWIIFKVLHTGGKYACKSQFHHRTRRNGKDTQYIFTYCPQRKSSKTFCSHSSRQGNVRNRTFAFRIHRRRHSLHIRSVVHNACTPCPDRNGKPKNLSVLAGTANARSPHC